MNHVAIGTLLLHASLVVRSSTDTAKKKTDPAV